MKKANWVFLLFTFFIFTGCCDPYPFRNDMNGVANMALFVNNINNLITAYGVGIAVVTLIASIAGFYSLKTISRLKSRVQGNFNKINALEKKIEVQSSYLYESSDCIYDILRKVVGDSKKENEELYHGVQKLNLFSSYIERRRGALFYFSQKGNEQDIEKIEYIAKYDEEDDIRNKAKEVIGRIKERLAIQE